FADTLDKAARVYAGLTGGGGGGVANLYRAEIAARRGDWAMAERLACKAQEEMTGDRWMEPIITKLTKN
ncbi:MAG TPA: hypothetical protein VJY37_05480, partial [Anaerovoracaceae bacterium]|nr:hypothetical protein [Anaerovoracaceae bacterium]